MSLQRLLRLRGRSCCQPRWLCSDATGRETLFDNDERPFFRAFSAFLAAHPLYWIWSVGDRLLLPSSELQVAANEATAELMGSETIVTHPYWSVVGLGLSVGMLSVVPLYARMYVARLDYRPEGKVLELTTNEPFGMRGKPVELSLSEVSLFGDRNIRPVEEAQYLQLEVHPWQNRMLRGRCLVDRRGNFVQGGEERLVRLLGGSVATFPASVGGVDNAAGDPSSQNNTEPRYNTSTAAQAHELLEAKRKAQVGRRGGRRRRGR